MAHAICQYCAHHNIVGAASCLHCGGPLRDVVRGVEAVITSAAPVVEPVLAAAGKEAEKGAEKAIPRWQWQAVALAVVVLITLCFFLARSFSLSMPSVPQLTAAQALPQLMRSAAACERVEATGKTERCVIPAGHPLLFGGLTAGHELSLYVQLSAPAQLTDTIRRWRAAGGTILLDGTVFAAVGQSATVLYADTRAGLRLETGTFIGPAAAQTFLSRSGLVR